MGSACQIFVSGEGFPAGHEMEDEGSQQARELYPRTSSPMVQSQTRGVQCERVCRESNLAERVGGVPLGEAMRVFG